MSAPSVVFRGYMGLEGTAGTYDVLAANIAPFNQSGKVTQHWEDEIIKDNHGYDMAWLMRNENAQVEVDVYLLSKSTGGAAATAVASPVAVVAPGAAAGAALSNLLMPFLTPGSVVNLSGFAVTGFNGTYRLLAGAEASITNTGLAKYNLKLLKYANSDQQLGIAIIPA
jgi:hypothetical protein